MSYLLTTDQCIDFTFKDRDTWQEGRNGRKPAMINCNHVKRYLPKQKVAKLTQAVMNELRDKLREERDSSNRTINAIKTALQTALNHCIDVGKLPALAFSVPWSHAGHYKFETLSTRKAERHFFSQDDVMRMYHAARDIFNDLDLAESFLLSAYTGMGWDEWSQVMADDVVLGAQVPYIEVGMRPGFTVKRPSRIRRCRLAGTSAELLIPILDRRIREVGNNAADIWLFGDDWSSQDSHRQKFNRVRDYCRLSEKLTPHCFRHSYCSWLISKDVEISKVSKMMGHADINTTLTYVHHKDDDLDAAAGLI